MKKLLFQLDTDTHPSVFDTVVAYDGGADHVIGHAGLTPGNVAPLVDGTIFTRAPKDKNNTAIFVGGSDLGVGEELFAAIQKHFFAGFRVSLMLDSNGCNTTAAAGVARLIGSGSIAGKRAVVLAGTGPVGQRAAVMLAKEGAHVSLTSRTMSGAKKVRDNMYERFGVKLTPLAAANNEARGQVVDNAQIIFACGAAGIALLNKQYWQNNTSIEMMADANATPPLGIEGTEMMDKGELRDGKKVWGALGFGALKLALHRACIARLFETNDLVLDAEEIFAIAKKMA